MRIFISNSEISQNISQSYDTFNASGIYSELKIYTVSTKMRVEMQEGRFCSETKLLGLRYLWVKILASDAVVSNN